jgi:hypothetical protein
VRLNNVSQLTGFTKRDDLRPSFKKFAGPVCPSAPIGTNARHA